MSEFTMAMAELRATSNSANRAIGMLEAIGVEPAIACDTDFVSGFVLMVSAVLSNVPPDRLNQALRNIQVQAIMLREDRAREGP